MRKILSFHRGLATALGLLVIVLTILIVVDVSGRFFFNKPLKGGVEISRAVLAWILFLSLAYGLIQRAHVRVTLITMRLKPRLHFMAEVFTALVSLLFFGFGFYSGWEQFKLSFVVGEEMAAPIWIPFWLPKLALPIGCFLIGAHLIIDLVSHFQNAGGEPKP
jgi:TRAP-type C4-dicarboxylate transport system permease small subunit